MSRASVHSVVGTANIGGSLLLGGTAGACVDDIVAFLDDSRLATGGAVHDLPDGNSAPYTAMTWQHFGTTAFRRSGAILMSDFAKRHLRRDVLSSDLRVGVPWFVPKSIITERGAVRAICADLYRLACVTLQYLDPDGTPGICPYEIIEHLVLRVCPGMPASCAATVWLSDHIAAWGVAHRAAARDAQTDLSSLQLVVLQKNGMANAVPEPAPRQRKANAMRSCTDAIADVWFGRSVVAQWDDHVRHLAMTWLLCASSRLVTSSIADAGFFPLLRSVQRVSRMGCVSAAASDAVQQTAKAVDLAADAGRSSPAPHGSRREVPGPHSKGLVEQFVAREARRHAVFHTAVAHQQLFDGAAKLVECVCECMRSSGASLGFLDGPLRCALKRLVDVCGTLRNGAPATRPDLPDPPTGETLTAFRLYSEFMTHPDLGMDEFKAASAMFSGLCRDAATTAASGEVEARWSSPAAQTADAVVHEVSALVSGIASMTAMSPNGGAAVASLQYATAGRWPVNFARKDAVVSIIKSMRVGDERELVGRAFTSSSLRELAAVLDSAIWSSLDRSR